MNGRGLFGTVGYYEHLHAYLESSMSLLHILRAVVHVPRAQSSVYSRIEYVYHTYVLESSSYIMCSSRSDFLHFGSLASFHFGSEKTSAERAT